MNNFRKGKQAFEKQGLETLSGYINEEWIKNDKWNDFIKSSIDFVQSLEENEVKKGISRRSFLERVRGIGLFTAGSVMAGGSAYSQEVSEKKGLSFIGPNGCQGGEIFAFTLP